MIGLPAPYSYPSRLVALSFLSDEANKYTRLKPIINHIPQFNNDGRFSDEDSFRDVMREVFICIVSMGIGPIYVACVDRLDELIENEHTSDNKDNFYPDNRELKVLYGLNKRQLEEVVKIIVTLRESLSRIVMSLHSNNNHHQEVILYEYKNEKGHVQARIETTGGGGICLFSDAAPYVTPLMTPGVVLSECKEDPNLAGIRLHGQDLSHSNLSSANFSSTTITEVNFSHADLNHVDFRDANLINVNLCGVNLKQVNLIGTKIKLSLPAVWNVQSLKAYFGQLNSSSNGHANNLASAIMSIHNNYANLKINLIHQVIDSFRQTDISCIKDELVFILSYAIFWKDERIKAFKSTLN